MEVFNRLRKSEFLKNTVTLISGTVLAQVIPIFFSPLLTRLYTEEHFGVYGAFNALAMVLAVVATGRYHLAIMLPAKDKNAISLTIGSVIISFVYSVIIAFLLYLMGSQAFAFFGYEKVLSYMYYLPIVIFFVGSWNALNFWSSRNKTFSQNAKSKIGQSVSYATSSTILGWQSFASIGGEGLIFGRTLSYFMGCMLLINKKLFVIIKKNSIKRIIHNLKIYQNYPKFTVLPALLDTASLQAPFFIIGKYYSIALLGYYSLTYMIISIPSVFIGASFSQVFYQRISELNRSKGSLKAFFLKNTLIIFTINLSIYLVIFLFGTTIFTIIYGYNWVESGQYAEILSIGFLVKSTVSPFSSVFNALNKIKLSSAWQTFYFFSTFITLFTAASLDLDIFTFLTIYSAHEVILYLIYYYLAFKITK